ncbi:unnamed protein product [Polarella glacialis]|uniref:Thioredoxin domain-containing protein n=1 Tax=Polarella glacialis TaxID=89957 RepID=A0A813HRU1_POLGL|nr:unnamed protein product [Polarella glacialis]CAE8689996.1 unnamed protein product [Polarella glacialis]|mmetsp:Transcript_6636/g.10613  ORF Transcript_6636/g.10613 Transcript_6636/m.10613 type:complete len:149 (+) Transcript_6636:55-501(+)
MAALATVSAARVSSASHWRNAARLLQSQRRRISDVASSTDFQSLSAKAGGPPVLVFFTATWCQPCREVAPHLRELSRRLEGPHLRIARIDVQETPDLAREQGVEAVPQFLVLRDGQVVERLAGNGPEAITEVAERHAASFAEMLKKSK